MNIRRRVVEVIIVVVLVIVLTMIIEVLARYIHSGLWEFFQTYKSVIYAFAALVGGILSIQMLSSAVLIWLKKSREAYLVRNVVLVFGYIVLGFVVASIIGVSGETLLASATFSGFVIGLALQPVLANFFSGLLILLSGFIKPGQDVRVAGGIPISLLSFPAYKFFSRDHMIPSLRGRVIEIGLMYTKIVDIDGQVVKIPNNILLNTSIVVEETYESKVVQIRYEFPVLCDPDTVLSELNSSLQKILMNNNYSLYIEEQSDKQYYIVLLKTLTPPNTKTREFRSKLLKEFIKTHRELINKGLCIQKPIS